VTDQTRRIWFVLLTLGIYLGLNILIGYYQLGWRPLAANIALVIVLQGMYAAWFRDAIIVRWLIFGVASGFAELATDAWIVGTGTLEYPTGEPMLWRSPTYMPFAWVVVLSQIGGIGDWLRGKMPLLPASVATAAVSGINIPIYEHIAKDANWWVYLNTPMIGNAPYYIIAAEFLLALPLPWIGHVAAQRPVAWGLALGVLEGGVMFAASYMSFALLGR
jgi:hypothetical protein